MFEIVEHPDKLESFEELLRPYGIKETIRTGRIAMRRALGERRDRDAGRMRVLAYTPATLARRPSRPITHEEPDDEGLLRR